MGTGLMTLWCGAKHYNPDPDCLGRIICKLNKSVFLTVFCYNMTVLPRLRQDALHRARRMGRHITCPSLLFCLKANSPFPAQLQHKVILLVQVCEVLEFPLIFIRVLQQRGVNKVSHLPSLIDIKSPEALASVKFCINYIPIHTCELLFPMTIQM